VGPFRIDPLAPAPKEAHGNPRSRPARDVRGGLVEPSLRALRKAFPRPPESPSAGVLRPSVRRDFDPSMDYDERSRAGAAPGPCSPSGMPAHGRSSATVESLRKVRGQGCEAQKDRRAELRACPPSSAARFEPLWKSRSWSPRTPPLLHAACRSSPLLVARRTPCAGARCDVAPRRSPQPERVLKKMMTQSSLREGGSPEPNPPAIQPR